MKSSDAHAKSSDHLYPYREEIRMNAESVFYNPPKYKEAWIRWADETMELETQREAYEWISNGRDFSFPIAAFADDPKAYVSYLRRYRS